MTAVAVCTCTHDPHRGPCRVLLGFQLSLDGGRIPRRCECDAGAAPPMLPGFGSASEEVEPA